MSVQPTKLIQTNYYNNIYNLYSILTSILKIHSNKHRWACSSKRSAFQVLVHICCWVGVHVDVGMSKEWWVCTYTTIADTSATTVTARLCTLLQCPTTAVMPFYFRSILALAIANNVIITTWSFLSPTWAVGVCECGVGDKAVVRKEHSQSSILIN